MGETIYGLKRTHRCTELNASDVGKRVTVMGWAHKRRNLANTAASILTPAGILTAAGLILGFVSTNGIISQLGSILGRGAAISAAMVLLFLPALLIIFDGLIQKTMKGYMKKQEREEELI